MHQAVLALLQRNPGWGPAAGPFPRGAGSGRSARPALGLAALARGPRLHRGGLKIHLLNDPIRSCHLHAAGAAALQPRYGDGSPYRWAAIAGMTGGNTRTSTHLYALMHRPPETTMSPQLPVSAEATTCPTQPGSDALCTCFRGHSLSRQISPLHDGALRTQGQAVQSLGTGMSLACARYVPGACPGMAADLCARSIAPWQVGAGAVRTGPEDKLRRRPFGG